MPKSPAHLIDADSDHDGHFTRRCSACFERIPQADETYRFCPFCSAALSGEIDRTTRRPWEPRWHARAASLGIDPETIQGAESPEYLWTHERYSEVNNRWERGDSQDAYPTADRRQALRGYNRARRHGFAGWRFRMVYVARTRNNTETVIGYALETTLSEHTILTA